MHVNHNTVFRFFNGCMQHLQIVKVKECKFGYVAVTSEAGITDLFW